MEEQFVGKVTHYFARPGVAALRLESGIRTGDLLRFRGHTTDFEQRVASLQIEHEAVPEAQSGADVGIEVKQRVRKGDSVFKVVGAE